MKTKLLITNYYLLSNIVRYLKIWWKMTRATFRVDFTNRFAAVLFILGKAIRFFFFLGFLLILLSRTRTLVGYNVNQVIFFFLTFNLIDISVQLFLRGVYHFRPLIIRGDFDLILVKPINPLFTSLTSHADILDLITLFPLAGYIIFFLVTGQIQVTLVGIILYFALVVCSLIIGLAFHIIVLAIGILTTEVDHLIWIYRDLSGMGRIPIDVYREWLRTFLVFVIPVGVLMTFPAKALMGLLSPQMVVFSFLLAGALFYLSLRFWKFALRRYSSASS